MAQKLWEKSVQVDRDVERFTVGKDREMDLYLAPFDILGSLDRKSTRLNSSHSTSSRMPSSA